MTRTFKTMVLALLPALAACSGLKPGSVAPGTADASARDASAPDANAPDAASDGTSDAGDGSAEVACDAATGFSAWYTLPSIDISPDASVTGAPAAADTLALFAVDSSGRLQTTRASTPITAAAWSAWTPVDGAPPFPPGAAVTAVARSAGIDLYGISADQSLVTLRAGTTTWVPVGSGAPTFASPRPVAAVARDEAHLHVLAIADDGRVWESTAGYEDAGDAGFSAWAPLGGGGGEGGGGGGPSFPPGNVAIAARPGHLDALALAADSRVYDSARSFTPTDPTDSGWQPWIATGHPEFAFPAGTPIAAGTFKDYAEVDIFAVNGGVQIDLRNDNWFAGEWYGWFPVGSDMAKSKPIVGVASGVWSLDVFRITIDPPGVVQTTSYQATMPNGGATGGSDWVTVPWACANTFSAASVQVFVGAGVEQLVAVDMAGALHGTSRAPPN